MPVFIDGTGPIFGKGMKRPKPGRTKVDLRCAAVAGRRREHAPLQRPHRGRRDSASATKRSTDYWTARQRAARGTSPSLTGPEYNGWRRQWELCEHRKLGAAGLRRRQKRRWPDLG